MLFTASCFERLFDYKIYEISLVFGIKQLCNMTSQIYDVIHFWKTFIEYFIVVIKFWGYFNSLYFIYYWEGEIFLFFPWKFIICLSISNFWIPKFQLKVFLWHKIICNWLEVYRAFQKHMVYYVILSPSLNFKYIGSLWNFMLIFFLDIQFFSDFSRGGEWDGFFFRLWALNKSRVERD